MSVWFCLSPPCFFWMTSLSWSSSQSSMPSSSFSALLSVYRSFLADFLSTAGSWENLHLAPFLHSPCL